MFGWGKKPEPPPVLEADQGPPGEVEKLLQIKNLCWMAKMSAESIAGLSADDLKDEFNQYELDRYKKLMLEATNLAREITDEFYRDSALHFLIGPLMVAGDEPQAKQLFKIIEVDIIQESVLKDYPRLGAKF